MCVTRLNNDTPDGCRSTEFATTELVHSNVWQKFISDFGGS